MCPTMPTDGVRDEEATMATTDGSDLADRYVRAITVIAGAGFTLFGVWAFVAPSSFFSVLATFEPYNAHFLRDVGAFQLGLGAVLLLSLTAAPARAIVLGGVGVGAAAHALGHVVDAGLGGAPTDVPTFAGLAVALLVGAWLARGRRPEPAPRTGARPASTH